MGFFFGISALIFAGPRKIRGLLFRGNLVSTRNLEYVGFWPRVGATIIDVLLQMVIVLPITYAIYGRFSSPTGAFFMGTADLVVNFILPAVAVIALWVRFGATPGKMAMSAKVVDADTGEPLTIAASLLRYVGYFISTIPLGLGLIWVGLDRKKQGWHDKLANSVVIRPAGEEQVRFKKSTDWRDGDAPSKEPRF